MKKPEKISNKYIYLTILTVFIVMGTATFLHDPILHTLVAWANGWQFSSYSASIGIGSTDALVSKAQIAQTPTFNYWLFFMFPSVFIFVFSFIVIVFHPDRLFMVAGNILIMLNFSSLLPTVQGSDAYKAIQFLITRGYPEPTAYFIHYVILIIMFIVYALYLYIVIENNPKDAGIRMRNIWE